MTVTIETKDAALKTMSVTIRALQVSSKQMTLAVFRQLPQARVFNEDGTLVGGLEHWGLVRYDIKDEGRKWVVASRDGALYRCSTDFGVGSVDHCTRELQAAIAHRDRLREHKRQEMALRAWRERFAATKKSFPEPEPASNSGFEVYSKWSRRCDEWARAQVGEEPQHPDPLAYTTYGRRPRDLQDAEAEITRAQQELQVARKYAVSRAVINALPQLFIAV